MVSIDGDKGSHNLKKLFENPATHVGDDWEDRLTRSTNLVTRPMCTLMLHNIGLDENRSEPFSLLDLACGTGVVGSAVQQMVKPELLQQSRIISGDFAEPMVQVCKRRSEREKWLGDCKAEVMDAQKLELPDQSFTHVTVGLGFHLIPDAEAALQDCIRVLQPGGELALTTMHEYNPGWSPDFRGGFESIGAPFPARTPQQIHKQGHWYDNNWVKKNLIDHGLRDVKVEVRSIVTPIASAAAFVEDFSQMIDLVTGVMWDEDTRKKFDKQALKEAVKKHCEQKYGGEGWDLVWTIIVASGRKAQD